MLFEYQQEVQQLLGDQSEQKFNLADLTNFINRARRKIAAATQCIRCLPPSSGSFLTITLEHTSNPILDDPSGNPILDDPGGNPVLDNSFAGGSGYSSPTVTISGPDGIGLSGIQATAVATFSGGVITGFIIINPGSNYVSPTITITDPTGTGAVAVYTLTPFVSANPGQEVYTFASVNPIIQDNFPGFERIIALQSVAVSWGSWKPSMRNLPWSLFQAYCRAWNIGEENYPTVWSQYGQGENGSIYLYPIPSTICQMDWDCYCSPIDLLTNEDIEALPHPFTEAVPFYAAYWAYMSAQNQDMAEVMWTNYSRMMKEARSYVSPAMIPDYYGSSV